MPGVQTSNPAHRDRIGISVLRIGFVCTSANRPWRQAESKNQLWLLKEFVSGDNCMPRHFPRDGARFTTAIGRCPNIQPAWRADGQSECLSRAVH
jgi:hypothetical protein